MKTFGGPGAKDYEQCEMAATARDEVRKRLRAGERAPVTAKGGVKAERKLQAGLFGFLLGTGGIFAQTYSTQAILGAATASQTGPACLRPTRDERKKI